MGAYEPEVDEIPLSGLSILPSTKIDVPRIKERRCIMECKLHQMLPMRNGAESDTDDMRG